jgi:hypothetical protein
VAELVGIADHHCSSATQQRRGGQWLVDGRGLVEDDEVEQA